MYEEFKPNFEGLPEFAREDQEKGHLEFLPYPKRIEGFLAGFATNSKKVEYLHTLESGLNKILWEGNDPACNWYNKIERWGRTPNIEKQCIWYWDYLESLHWLTWKIDELNKMQTQEQSMTESTSEPTTPFQVLIIHYLLKYCNFELDGKQKTKLITAITGKNFKNTYDAVLKPLGTKKGKLRLKEIDQVRKLFESIGLGEISNLITKDLQ